MFFRKSSFEFRESNFDRACAQRDKDRMQWLWDACCRHHLEKYGEPFKPHLGPYPDRERGGGARPRAARERARAESLRAREAKPVHEDQQLPLLPLTLSLEGYPRPPEMARPAPRARRYPARERITSGALTRAR